MIRVRKHLKYPLRRPGIVPRAINNFFQIFVLKRPRLRGVEFALNYRCQCRCEHCSAALLGASDRPPMTTARIVEALDEMDRLGVMNVNFTGGEALLHPDLETFVRAARPANKIVTLATNGLLLDREAAVRLKAWGVQIVSFSLDSADPARHDRFRGAPGCHQAVMAGTQHCLDLGLEPYWCTVMTPENVRDGDLLRMIEVAAARGIVLTINQPCPVGRWRDKSPQLSAEELSLHRRLMKLPNVRWEGHSNFRAEGCPAGIEKLYVSPYGDVMPCPFIHISFGNLTERPLAAIWNEMLAGGPFNVIRGGCPLASDPEFVAKHIAPIYESGCHPLPYERHPASRGGPP